MLAGPLEDALETLGALLEERDQRIGVLIIGGSSLLLLGIVDRPTGDVDVLGMTSADGYVAAETMPGFLVAAAREVGDTLGLNEGWFNSGPAGMINFGLPTGLEHRVTVRRFGALEVHLPAVEDLICFKLYAAVDLTERSKHFADLQALHPTREQLIAAAKWTRMHDPSPGFEGELVRILELLGVSDADI